MKTLGAVVLAATAAFGFEYGLKPVQVNDAVFCYFGAPEVINVQNNGNMVNSCFVDTLSGWLVVDSGPTYMYAKEALLHVNTIKTQKVTHVINTHIHDDHWLGNGFYADLGAEILGPSQFNHVLPSSETTRMERRISKEAYKGTVPTSPDTLIDTSGSVRIGSLDVQILHVDHKAHTAGDLFVYIPKLQTLFAGDLVFNERLPSLRDGSINGWIAALEQVRSYKPRSIVGGHGALHDAKALDFTYGYLVALRDAVRAAIADGVEIDDAVNQITMDAYKTVALYDEMHRANVEVAYRMLEWEDE